MNIFYACFPHINPCVRYSRLFEAICGVSTVLRSLCVDVSNEICSSSVDTEPLDLMDYPFRVLLWRIGYGVGYVRMRFGV